MTSEDHKTDHQTGNKEKIAKKKKLVFFLLIVLISIVFLEVSLRMLGIRNFKIPHHILLHKVHPSYKSVDANGFRNKKVLTKADIVTIGDSHTFGYNVSAQKSWPQQLAKMSEKTSIQSGVGGYGILQYHYLLDQAIAMEPDVIVVGILFANDLSDILELIVRRPYWQEWCTKRKKRYYGYHSKCTR